MTSRNSQPFYGAGRADFSLLGSDWLNDCDDGQKLLGDAEKNNYDKSKKSSEVRFQARPLSTQCLVTVYSLSNFLYTVYQLSTYCLTVQL